MSEEVITPVEPALEAPAPEEPLDLDRAKSKIEKVNREAAALRARLKELEPLAKRAQELDDAQKSEAQRATEALTAAEQRAAAAEAKLLRAEVAEAKGLTAAQARRLVGATREELLADADDYLASLPQAPTAPGQRTPVEALRPGALPNPGPLSLDEQIAAANKAGDWRAVIHLQNEKLANHTT